MNKEELTQKLYKRLYRYGLSLKLSSLVIDTFVSIVREALSEGDTIALRNLGTFRTEVKKKNVGNFHTGERKYIQDYRVAKFIVSKRVKKLLNP